MRLEPIDREQASTEVTALLGAVEHQLGRVPNLYLAMAGSPPALAGYLGLRGALVGGALSVEMIESIALLTAAMNDCDYCVAAHCFRGSKVGIDDDRLASIRKAEAADSRTAAALSFVASMLERRGRVTDEEFDSMKAVGWSDQEIGEIVGHVALNVFSNYFNHVAQPDLDFPEAP